MVKFQSVIFIGLKATDPYVSLPHVVDSRKISVCKHRIVWLGQICLYARQVMNDAWKTLARTPATVAEIIPWNILKVLPKLLSYGCFVEP